MNTIIRSLVCDGSVSLAVMDTTRLVNDAIAIHNTPRTASSILGQLLTCAAYIASALKTEGSISLTVKAKDGDGAVSVSSDGALHVRGYVDGTCTQTLAGGTLTVVRSEGAGMPFVGACGVENDDISDVMSAYFQMSEQIPTSVAVCCDIGAGGGCLCAGGVIMQLMPGAGDEAVNAAAEAFEDYCANPSALLDYGAEGVLGKFFSRLGVSDKYCLSPEYKCNCSEKRISEMLLTLGKEELLKIIEEQGAVSVHCHYCNRDYVYDRRKIEELFRT